VPRDRNPDATQLTHDVRYRPPVVRTRSRSHTSRLALAGLGIAAGLVALASNAQPTRPAEAAVRDETPSEIVRGIDFTTVAQPGSACTDVLEVDTPRLIPVEHSRSRLLDEARLAQLEIDDRVLYGDLDGDGTDEAVVRATCLYGANGAQATVQVWTVNRRVPVLVDTISGAPDDVADDSRLPPAVHDVAVTGGDVVVTFTTYADDDPHCCPSGQAIVTYALDEGLEPVGRPVTGPLES
jgi:LppP/LprE lipoprotein